MPFEMKKFNLKTERGFLAYCKEQAKSANISPAYWLETDDGSGFLEFFCDQCIDAQANDPENIANGLTVIKSSKTIEENGFLSCQDCGRLLSSIVLAKWEHVAEIERIIDKGEIDAEDFAVIASFMRSEHYDDVKHYFLIEDLVRIVLGEKGRSAPAS